MKTIVPDYYFEFKCIADKCKHTCCKDFEIDIDEYSLSRFLSNENIKKHIEFGETPHFKLLPDEKCPFLREDGFCQMIIDNGEDFLCQICSNHPRFKNFFSGITEIGLGLVCEEAARIILTRQRKMTLVEIQNDGFNTPLNIEEQYLLDLREDLLKSITETGPRARLKEYLIFRYIPDALFDGMIEARLNFINSAYNEIVELWEKSDGLVDSIIEITRKWSYDNEYDDEVIEKRIFGETK